MAPESARIIGRIAEGVFDVTPEALQSAVRGWPDGVVVIDLCYGGKKRTLAQNRTWFKFVVEPFCEHTGVDRHDRADKMKVHDGLVRLCFGETWNETFKCFMPNKRSSDLNTRDFAEMTDWAVRYLAQEYGLVLRLPSERDA